MTAPMVGDVSSRLIPKLLTVLRQGYSREQFGRDVMAGVIVGIVALPLAIAFGIASGVKPEQGLYTAIVAGFLISALGGSRVQIGGPTGAFIVIVAQIVHEHGYQGLAVATLMAGVLLIGMGVARLGAAIKFVPYPVTIGFTSGIALIIAIGQLGDAVGLRLEAPPAAVLERLATYASHLGTWNPATTAVAAASLLILILWPRVAHRIPGPLVAILAATAAVALFDLPVDTIGSRFGAVPSHLPAPALPTFRFAELPALFPAAFTIALLGAIESLLSAVVADGMIGTRHRSNMELVAQGVANLAAPLFGGIPATGAIARTATNVKNGGRTPIAGMVHALTLVLIMVLFGRWAVLIPIPALAAVLLVVAYHMSEWRVFVGMFRNPRSDVAVMLTTFALTVLVDLTVALEVGMVLAAFLFMNRMASISGAGYVTRMLATDEEEAEDPSAVATRQIPPGVEVFEVYGTFFFGAVSKFKDALATVQVPPRVLIVRLREVIAIDATGLRTLEDLLEKTRRDGTALLLAGVHAQPLVALDRAGLLERIGAENVVGELDEAVARAAAIVADAARAAPPVVTAQPPPRPPLR